MEENVNLLKLPDIFISDSNKNILYCRSYEDYINYCNKNNLDCSKEYSPNYASQFLEKTQNSIKYLFILPTTTTPKINEKMYININKISLSSNLTIDKNDTLNGYTKQGDWNLEINLKEK